MAEDVKKTDAITPDKLGTCIVEHASYDSSGERAVVMRTSGDKQITKYTVLSLSYGQEGNEVDAYKTAYLPGLKTILLPDGKDPLFRGDSKETGQEKALALALKHCPY